MPSTRTPEGMPSRCPLCGEETNLDFSDPAGDATCPSCGCLIWQAVVRLEQIREIIQGTTGKPPEDVTADTSFIDDLGMDSLDTVELIMELEEEFDVKIPPEEAEQIRTVADAIRYILRLRRDNDNPPE